MYGKHKEIYKLTYNKSVKSLIQRENLERSKRKERKKQKLRKPSSLIREHQ